MHSEKIIATVFPVICFLALCRPYLFCTLPEIAHKDDVETLQSMRETSAVCTILVTTYSGTFKVYSISRMYGAMLAFGPQLCFDSSRAKLGEAATRGSRP